MKRAGLLLLGLLAILLSPPVFAHKPSDSFLALSLSESGRQVAGQWDIALRDLEFQLGLDNDQDGQIVWGELTAARAAIEGHAFSRLTIRLGGQSCPIAARDLLFDRHSDGGYAVLLFTAECARQIDEIEVEYRLFFETDRQHKGLLKLSAGNSVQSAVFDAETPRRKFHLTEVSAWKHFTDYVTQGVWHIWVGIDHILFLLALLIPAVLLRQTGAWTPIPSFRAAFLEVFKIVTAFTLAHSLTLSAATLGWVSLPSRLVESVIALSVAFAALNNLAPKIARQRWLVAFGFGLVHGFGFASVLSDLGLPSSALLIALLSFNVGVELGQLAIVSAFLPIAFSLRSTRFYELVIVRGGSMLIAVLASLWLTERAFDVKFMPF